MPIPGTDPCPFIDEAILLKGRTEGGVHSTGGQPDPRLNPKRDISVVKGKEARMEVNVGQFFGELRVGCWG